MEMLTVGMIKQWKRLRPRFMDFDLLGHLNHTAYLLLFEEVRVPYMMRVLGIEQPGHIPFYIRRVEVDYRLPVEWGMDVMVGVGVNHTGNSSIVFDHYITDVGHDVIFATGRTVHVMVKNGRAVRIPDDMVSAFERHENRKLRGDLQERERDTSD